MAGWLLLRVIFPVVALFSQAVAQGGPERVGQPSMITFGLDPIDYNEIAEDLARSILESKDLVLDGTKVLAMGPVSTDDCLYSVDERALQDRLIVVLKQSGKLQVSYAVDLIEEGSPAIARFEILRSQWAIDQAMDGEEIKSFGKQASIDYLLFGRISARTTTAPKDIEVHYRFNWKMGQCDTGLLGWTWEAERTKRGGCWKVPEWAEEGKRRSDSQDFFYEVGEAIEARSEEGAQQTATEEARQKLIERIHGSAPVRAFAGITPKEVSDGVYFSGAGKGCRCWVMVRVERTGIAEIIARVEQETDLTQKAQSHFLEAEKEADPFQKICLLNDAERFWAQYSKEFSTSDGVGDPRRAWRGIAQVRKAKGDFSGALGYLERVRSAPTPGEDEPGERQAAEAEMADMRSQLAKDAGPLELKARMVNLFGCRTVRIVAATVIDDKTSPWPGAEDKVRGVFSQCGARIDSVDGQSLSGMVKLLDQSGPSQVSTISDGIDFCILLEARGKMNRVDKPSESIEVSSDRGSQFTGTITTTLLASSPSADTNAVYFSDQYPCVTGWNPMGDDMCLGVLAIKVAERFQTKLSVQLMAIPAAE